VTIPAEEQDKRLTEKLKAELPGILRWAIAGAVAWYTARDLGAPAAVLAATEEYRSVSDSLGAFLEERCYQSLNAFVSASQLYEAYKKWAEQRGEHPKNMTTFGESLSERGFPKKKLNTGIIRLGIGLISSEHVHTSEHFSGKSSHVEIYKNEFS
jgi:putative DNA primase/helicase